MNHTQVEKFGRIEIAGEAAARVDNPYVALSATVLLHAPDGSDHRLPLYWDGQSTWKWRFSPFQEGDWHWQVESEDAGLAGQAGHFRVVYSARAGGIQMMENHRHHFQRQNGEPFWFLGDTAWALYTDGDAKQHDRAQVEHYIDTRATQGFNVVHSMLLSEAGWGNRGGDAFVDLDAEQINPAYWREVDERLVYLNRKGIVGGLVLAWGDKGRNPNDWREFPSQAARLRYAQYIAARYSAFDIYFIVAGEWNADLRNTPDLSEEQARADYAEIGRVLRQSDPHGRMIAIHPMTGGTAREFAGEDWIDFADYQQMYPYLHTEALASRRVDKPVVNSEYAYYLRDSDEDGQVDKDNSFSIDAIRHASWDIVMAGGYLVTGFGSTYFGGYRHPGPFAVDAPQNDIWEEQIQYISQLFDELTWWRLTPADALLQASEPRGEDIRVEVEGRQRTLWRPPTAAYWALAEEGRQYLVYVRGLTSALGLSGAAQMREHARQFNPRTGEFSSPNLTSGGETLHYTPPDAEDWVLIIKPDA